MQTLIVGVGALGGTIAARAVRAGLPVRLAARNTDSAEALRRSGLRLTGAGGEVRTDAIDVAAIADYKKGGEFDLILLATKAQDALEVALRRQISAEICLSPSCIGLRCRGADGRTLVALLMINPFIHREPGENGSMIVAVSGSKKRFRLTCSWPWEV